MQSGLVDKIEKDISHTKVIITNAAILLLIIFFVIRFTLRTSVAVKVFFDYDKDLVKLTIPHAEHVKMFMQDSVIPKGEKIAFYDIKKINELCLLRQNDLLELLFSQYKLLSSKFGAKESLVAIMPDIVDYCLNEQDNLQLQLTKKIKEYEKEKLSEQIDNVLNRVSEINRKMSIVKKDLDFYSKIIKNPIITSPCNCKISKIVNFSPEDNDNQNYQDGLNSNIYYNNKKNNESVKAQTSKTLIVSLELDDYQDPQDVVFRVYFEAKDEKALSSAKEIKLVIEKTLLSCKLKHIASLKDPKLLSADFVIKNDKKLAKKLLPQISGKIAKLLIYPKIFSIYKSNNMK
jgi:hypothetical protein